MLTRESPHTNFLLLINRLQISKVFHAYRGVYLVVNSYQLKYYVES